jgi:hypothetical protein
MTQTAAELDMHAEAVAVEVESKWRPGSLIRDSRIYPVGAPPLLGPNG